MLGVILMADDDSDSSGTINSGGTQRAIAMLNELEQSQATLFEDMLRTLTGDDKPPATANQYYKPDHSGDLKPEYTQGPGRGSPPGSRPTPNVAKIGFKPNLVKFGGVGGKTGTMMASLASIESAGGKLGFADYGAVGPLVPKHVKGNLGKYDGHALGAFQVMAENVGPWAKEAGLGNVTPDQFMANPELQNKIVAHQMEKLENKGYGPKDIASIWFTGHPFKAGDAANDGITKAGDYAEKAARNVATLERQGGSDRVPQTARRSNMNSLNVGPMAEVADTSKVAANNSSLKRTVGGPG
jgi:hypothetical protein